MSELSKNIQKAILDSLQPKHLGQVDIVSIPKSSNRLMQLRSLEEVIDDFEMDQSPDSFTYVVKVKPRNKSIEKESSPSSRGDLSPGNLVEAEKTEKQNVEIDFSEIYQKEGRLNRDYLIKNAEILIRSGDYKDARKIYESLIKSNVYSAKIYFGFGLCLEKEHNYQKSQEAFEEAISFESKLLFYRSLYRVLKKQNKIKYSLEILDRSLSLSELTENERYLILKELAKSHSEQKNYDKAVSNYEKALEINPKSDQILNGLGSMYLKLGRLDDALKQFEKAEEINPKNSKAIFGLGCCYLIQNNKRLAFKCFLDSLKVDPNNSTAIYYLVKCAFELKNFDEPAKILKDYVQSSPVNSNLLYSLAAMQFHLRRYQESMMTSEKILKIQPNHQGAANLKGLNLEKIRSSH